MACLKSITKYSKPCKAVSGGVSQLFMIAYSDLKNVTGSLSKYTVDATGNMVSEIGLNAPTKKFVSVGILKNSVGIVENFAKTAETNSFEITTDLTLVVSDISVDSRTFVQTLVDAGDVAVIIKLKSGKFITAGLDGFLSVSAIAGGSGTAGSDLNGYTITLSGVENDLIKLVDPTIINTVVEA